MANVSIANSDSGLSGKTIDLLESDQTITGLKTFSRGAAAPFAVAVGSLNVANLDADKLDGLDSTAFLLLAGGTMVGDLKFTDNLYDIGKSGATRPRNIFAAGTGTFGGLITASAGVDLSANGQIIFPASQNASSGANTLDDYEEGTWTPTDASGASLSFSSVVGQYAKIGQMVFVAASVQYPITASGLQAGWVLPFTTNNSGTAIWGLSLSYDGSATNALGNIQGNSTTVLFYGLSSATVTNANLSNATVRFFGMYRASA